jgi:hypothetical protein
MSLASCAVVDEEDIVVGTEVVTGEVLEGTVRTEAGVAGKALLVVL